MISYRIRSITATFICAMLLLSFSWGASAQPKFAAQDATIRSIAFDQQGRMWVATFGRGLWVIRDSNISKYDDAEKQQPYPMINNLLCDGQYLWVATAGGGCIKINTATDQIEQVSQHTGFEKLHALTRTAAGQIIIGSVGSGTAYLKDNAWQPVKEAQSINLAWVNSVVEWQNKLWLGTSTGLYSNSTDLSDWRPQYEQLNRGVNHLAVSEDRLLIATTRHGLYSFKNGESPVRVAGIDGMIHFIQPVKDGALVIGEQSMWRLSTEHVQKLETAVTHAKCGAVDTKNRFFIGTTDGRIYRSDDGKEFKLQYIFSENGLEEQKQ
ncbi:MAG: hypothetical protein ACD_6C00280G0001 [uncultured bacterium]|nr:MAG: hypothetical protein ACD_6C00280G0001 [uncultured bacterium]